MFAFARRLSVALLALCLVGCGQRSAPPAVTPPTPSALTFHWLGTDHLLAHTNTAIAQVWADDSSRRLQGQTLNKLAGFLLHAAGRPADPAATNVLAGLLADALRSEIIFALALPSNQPPQLQLAACLDDPTALHWADHFARLFPPATNGFAPTLIRAGRWSLFQSRPDTQPASAVLARLHALTNQPASSNACLRLTADLGPLTRALGHPDLFGTAAPRLALHAAPVEGDLRVVATMDFAAPLGLNLSPWQIPTNLIRGRIDSFTAVRSLAPLIRSTALWDRLGFGTPPDQLFSWTPSGYLFQFALSFPEPEPAPRLARLNAVLLNAGNEWLKQHADGYFTAAEDGQTAVWKGLPFINPTLMATTNEPLPHLYLATMPLPDDESPFPVELRDFLAARPQLLYYDWQLTGPMVETWLGRSQLARLTFRRDQLPENSASLAWLKLLASRLGNSFTTVELASDRQLTFARRSPLGLTALELHLLADWLEAPGFPRRLRALEVQAPPLP